MVQFSGNVACPLRPGHALLIAGRSMEDANRVDINFQSGKYEDEVIAFHISIRFDEGTIIRNTRTVQGWGPEDRVENPLQPGDDFKIYILVSDYSFLMAVNDIPTGFYAYRAPLDIIRTIDVGKDVDVINRIDHRAVFPTLWPRLQIDGPFYAFSNDVPMKFQPGHVIVINGIPSGNSRGSFTLSFMENGSSKQALHFNARFEPVWAVVRNAMNDYLKFGAEERDGTFPFELDQPFRLAIAMTTDEFKFAVNGEYFAEFAYRGEDQLNSLNGLKITTGNLLNLAITGVDHISTGIEDCSGFEEYSNFDMILP